MMNSHTTPVTASSFPKWKSNKRRHIIEKSTGREFYFEQDPLSLKWNDVTPEIETLEAKETEPDGNKRKPQSCDSSRNSWPKILKISRKNSKQNKTQICETSAGSMPMVNIMSLVKKHLNKSKTNVANNNENSDTHTNNNFKGVGIESVRKNIKIENELKSEIVSSVSASTSKSINIKSKPLHHDHVKIKLEPSSYNDGQSDQEPDSNCKRQSDQEPSGFYAEENLQESSGLYSEENVQELSGHFAEVFDQEVTDYYAEENEREPSGKPEPNNYYTGDNEQKPAELSNDHLGNITEQHSNVHTVKIKKEFSGCGIVKIKKEPTDLDEPMQHVQPRFSPPTSLNEKISSSFGQPVSESHGSCITQSADITRLKTKQRRPTPKKDKFQSISLNEEDTLENSNKSFAVKVELTRIDDIFNFENESSVCLNSTSSKRSAKDCSSDSDKSVISDRKALELKYQCFSAEPKSKLMKRPDPKVLYDKTKLCRHSNRFLQNGESIECGCVRQNYLKCDICGLVLTNSSYTKHVQRHYKIRRYKCPNCTKIYKCTFQFHKHYNQCIKQTKFQCFKCQEVFKRFNFLKRHIATCCVNDFPYCLPINN